MTGGRRWSSLSQATNSRLIGWIRARFDWEIATQLFDTSGTGKIPKDEMAVILRDLAGMSPEDAEEALAVATAGQDDAEDFVDASALLDLLFSI